MKIQEGRDVSFPTILKEQIKSVTYTVCLKGMLAPFGIYLLRSPRSQEKVRQDPSQFVRLSTILTKTLWRKEKQD